MSAKTPDAVEDDFAKYYLTTGNVAEAARQAGISRDLGYRIRARLLADPEFLAMRERIREKLEIEIETMALSVAQECHRRVLEESGEKLFDKMLAKTDLKSFNDPGPAYAASFAKLVALFQQIFKERREADAANQQRTGDVSISFGAIAQESDRGGDQTVN